MARWSKLGLIAGGGTLPQRIASACTRRAEPIFIVRLKGMAEEDIYFARRDRELIEALHRRRARESQLSENRDKRKDAGR